MLGGESVTVICSLCGRNILYDETERVRHRKRITLIRRNQRTTNDDGVYSRVSSKPTKPTHESRYSHTDTFPFFACSAAIARSVWLVGDSSAFPFMPAAPFPFPASPAADAAPAAFTAISLE